MRCANAREAEHENEKTESHKVKRPGECKSQHRSIEHFDFDFCMFLLFLLFLMCRIQIQFKRKRNKHLKTAPGRDQKGPWQPWPQHHGKNGACDRVDRVTSNSFRIATWTLMFCVFAAASFSVSCSIASQHCGCIFHMMQLQTKLKYCSDMCTDAWLFIFVWCR